MPPAFQDQAYEDMALPIGMGQTISQPLVVALMTQALEAGDRHKVLEIGTGSGYQAAVLAKLCRRLYTIERHKDLLTLALDRFAQLRLHNITALCGDGTKGWPEQAPFDRIIVHRRPCRRERAGRPDRATRHRRHPGHSHGRRPAQPACGAIPADGGGAGTRGSVAGALRAAAARRARREGARLGPVTRRRPALRFAILAPGGDAAGGLHHSQPGNPQRGEAPRSRRRAA